MAEAWSYIQSGKTVGPVTEEDLRALFVSGQLRADDLVWHQGLADWTKAGEFPELRPPRIALAEPAAAAQAFAMGQAQAAPALDPRASVEGTLAALRATKPWVRFLGVLGIITLVLLVAGSLVVMGFSGLLFRTLPPGAKMIIPLAYLFIALLYFPPVLFLNRYASRIGDLLKSQSPDDLVRALEAQKSFWKFVGILALIMTCIYGLLFLVGITAALSQVKHLF